MAKIPIMLEAGRADGKLATSGAIFDENKGMFQSEINDIQDTLNSDNPNKPLSAKQGKVLKELLDAKVIEVGAVPIDTKPIEGNTTHVVNSDGLAKAFNKCNTAIITTDRIEDGAVTSEKIATSAFDSTLSVSGKIAPADVVGSELTKLEEELYGKIEIVTLEKEAFKNNGYWNLSTGNNHFSTNTYYICTDLVNFESILKIKVTLKNAGVTTIGNVIFFNADKEFISGVNIEREEWVERDVEIPEGTKYIGFTSLATDAEPKVEISYIAGKRISKEIEEIKSDVESVKESVNKHEGRLNEAEQTIGGITDFIKVENHKSSNLLNFDDADFVEGMYLSAHGSLKQGNYNTSGYINVESGKMYHYRYASVEDYKFSFIALYDADKTFVELRTNVVGGIEIPNGISYIRFSSNSTTFIRNNRCMVYEGDTYTYEDYFPPYEVRMISDNCVQTSSVSDKAITKDKLADGVAERVIIKQNAMFKKFPLSSGSSVELDEVGVKNNKSISFTSTIAEFSSIIIGQGKNMDYGGSWIEIDANSVIVYLYEDELTSKTYNHGLAIANNLQVLISSGDDKKAKLRICSNGATYEENIDFLGDRGKPFVESVGSILSDCTLGYSCQNINDGIWLFGDSYFNLTAINRWTSYLDKSKVLLDGHPGGKTKRNSIVEFDNLIKMGIPKMVVWCVGMNDYDGATADVTAVNANWMEGVNHLIDVCEKYGIQLVLSTIPTVYGGYSPDSGDNTFRYNKPKNDWVRASGYRYIDFAKAVGANDNTGLWYNNGLPNDMLETTSNGSRVHPTEYGARALYMQAIADVPELL